MGLRWAAAVALLLFSAASARADGSVVRGTITDINGHPLPGTLVTLSSDGDGAPLSAVTDEKGAYAFSTPAGRYHLRADLSGFVAGERRDLTVGGEPVVVDVSLTLASFRESVTVNADTVGSLLSEPSPNAPSIVGRKVIDSAMLPNSRYDDVLTLMPGVVRGPDDQISVGGARATEGALFVNGVNLTDPTTGQPGLVVPIEAVDSVEVHSGGYPADLGPATGGVTSLNTRAGAEQFHVSLDSLFPRLLFEGGAVQGVAFWEPNVGASGPLVKGRVFYEEGVSYRFDRNEFITLAGRQHNIFSAPQSWTQIDAQVSATHRVRAALAVDQQDTDHAHIGAFTPQASVPGLDQHAWSALLADRWSLGSQSSLELRGSIIHTDTSLTPDGSAPYVLGHQTALGSYFEQRDREAERAEGSVSYLAMPSTHHVLKIGTTVSSASLVDADESAPVTLLRGDGTTSRVVSFLPAAAAQVSSFETSAFTQDTWTARPWLTLDTGVRYDRSSALTDGLLSPRVAWTARRNNGRTSVSGSAGLFADKVVLGALSFSLLPVRVVSAFDSSGVPEGTPTTYTDAIGGRLRTPRAERWDIALDQDAAAGWVAHLRYQERRGSNGLVVEPSILSSSTGALTLTSSGRSLSRSAEVTVGHRDANGPGEIYVSYVRSSTQGDLNSFDAVEGTFREPLVQQNQRGPLETDVPNRVLAWGLFHLPGRLTVAPFLEARDGFRYSAVDDDWNYVGARNSLRLPWFGSLDLSLTRIVDLPRQLPSARVGIKLYNLVSVHSEREVQRSVAAPDFGARYDPTERDFSLVCVFLLGRH